MLMFCFKLHQQMQHLQKGEYIGHLEPPIEDMQQTPEDPES